MQWQLDVQCCNNFFLIPDASLQPFLAMIEKVDSSVTNLEQAAYKLDTYSKELGNTCCTDFIFLGLVAPGFCPHWQHWAQAPGTYAKMYSSAQNFKCIKYVIRKPPVTFNLLKQYY